MRILFRKVIDGFALRKRRTVIAEETVTENISSTGCFMFLGHEPDVGARVRMEIDMPDQSGAQACRLLCQGNVVRVEKNFPHGKVGVACTIDRYRMLAGKSAAKRRAE